MKLLGCIAVFSCVMLLCSGQADNSTTTENPPVTTTTAPISTSTPAPASTSTPGAASTSTPGAASTSTPAAASTSTPAAATTSTPAAATTSTPAAVPTTIPGVTTTPTEASTTTSAPGSTSTPERTTTAPGNETTEQTTTTPSGGSTTAGPVTTTVIPVADDGSYNVTGNNMTCILAKMEITLNLAFTTSSGNATREYGVRDATVDPSQSSDCSDKNKQKMTLTFQENSTITFYFADDSDNGKVSVDQLEIHIPNITLLFSDATSNQPLNFRYYSKLFEHNDKTKSFKCESEEKATLLDTNNQTTGSEVLFQKVQVQAFRTADDAKFGDAVLCNDDDNVSNVVPIAVGCALAGLVVIVLIAYLVGRRQKRQRGYESV